MIAWHSAIHEASTEIQADTLRVQAAVYQALNLLLTGVSSPVAGLCVDELRRAVNSLSAFAGPDFAARPLHPAFYSAVGPSLALHDPQLGIAWHEYERGYVTALRGLVFSLVLTWTVFEHLSALSRRPLCEVEHREFRFLLQVLQIIPT